MRPRSIQREEVLVVDCRRITKIICITKIIGTADTQRKRGSYVRKQPRTVEYHSEMRSALAEELQAYEQRLMLPALQVAAARRGVTVVSYLHDGVTLHFEDSNRASTIIAKMMVEVSEVAIGLFVQTKLEQE